MGGAWELSIAVAALAWSFCPACVGSQRLLSETRCTSRTSPPAGNRSPAAQQQQQTKRDQIRSDQIKLKSNQIRPDQISQTTTWTTPRQIRQLLLRKTFNTVGFAASPLV